MDFRACSDLATPKRRTVCSRKMVSSKPPVSLSVFASNRTRAWSTRRLSARCLTVVSKTPLSACSRPMAGSVCLAADEPRGWRSAQEEVLPEEREDRRKSPLRRWRRS
jgi:hypothetical protein